MTTSFHTDRAPVVVVGSKPDSKFPDIAPQTVVTTKSSIRLGSIYREKHNSRLISLIPVPELWEREYVRSALLEVKPDEVVALGGNSNDSENFVKEELGLVRTKVTVMSYYDRNYTTLKSLGWRKFLLMLHMLVIRGFKHWLRTALPDMFKNKDMQWLSRSTGINAILYAMEQYPNTKIIVVGIGLEAGSHHNEKGEFTDKSARSDRIFMKYWHNKKRPNVYTTDEKLHVMGGVPMWEGGVFFPD